MEKEAKLKIKELEVQNKELKLKLDKERQIKDGLVSKRVMALEVYNARRPYFTILIAAMFVILMVTALNGYYAITVAALACGLLAVKIASDYKKLEYLRVTYDLKVKSIKKQFNEVSENLKKMDQPPKPVNFTEVNK